MWNLGKIIGLFIFIYFGARLLLYISDQRSVKQNEEFINEYIHSYKGTIEEVRQDIRQHFDELGKKNIGGYILYLNSVGEWTTDKMVYFNEKGNRCYTRLLVKHSKNKDSKIDGLLELIGAKVDNQWYYLIGSTSYYPRVDYKYDYTTPFTFDELSYFANSGLVKNILYKDEDKYKVKETFFAQIFKEKDATNPEGDSIFKEKADYNRTNFVTQEKLDRIKKEQQESVKPILKEKSLFRKLFWIEDFFDRSAWKNRKQTEWTRY